MKYEPLPRRTYNETKTAVAHCYFDFCVSNRVKEQHSRDQLVGLLAYEFQPAPYHYAAPDSPSFQPEPLEHPMVEVALFMLGYDTGKVNLDLTRRQIREAFAKTPLEVLLKDVPRTEAECFVSDLAFLQIPGIELPVAWQSWYDDVGAGKLLPPVCKSLVKAYDRDSELEPLSIYQEAQFKVCVSYLDACRDYGVGKGASRDEILTLVASQYEMPPTRLAAGDYSALEERPIENVVILVVLLTLGYDSSKATVEPMRQAIRDTLAKPAIQSLLNDIPESEPGFSLLAHGMSDIQTPGIELPEKMRSWYQRNYLYKR